jgi:hypothetical protein
LRSAALAVDLDLPELFGNDLPATVGRSDDGLPHCGRIG